jgi:BlaI family transcriptional regulator, penicillinase repressor
VSPTRVKRLGDLQLRIMKILWERQEATVADVLQALNDDGDFAYTTIATMLRKMEARALVGHRIDGRTFIYRAVVGEADVNRSLTDHWIDRLFQGSLAEAVSHLLNTRDVSQQELRQLEKLIAERRKSR